ncbi:MAG: acyl-CoA desaturase [Candidatus Melainabacteria bacterium]|nr:acyl-CoA desaturase [Candidatus Melainabacteria bacterium]
MIVKLPRSLEFLDADRASRPLEEVKSLPRTSSPDRWLPFFVLHALCLSVLFVGFSREALILAVVLYLLRMFAITGFYHRYFSHRTFKTSRVAQFVFAFLGATAVQRGPLWWAAHHRAHHRHSDTEADIHSPVADSFWWSHMGWITCEANIPTDYTQVRDLARYPELVLLNRFDWVPPVMLGILIYALGEGMRAGGSDTSGAQLVAWGFFSTVVLFHATCSINSIGHLFGSRRFETGDRSRNNPVLAIITLGEGWHNNHHRFPGATRQGYAWWEVDITYAVLKVLEALGIVWDLTRPALEPEPELKKDRRDG